MILIPTWAGIGVFFSDISKYRLLTHLKGSLVELILLPAPRLKNLLLFQCMMSLQGCPLPEAAEILDILNRIEFEALFYSHDKLADLQVIQHFRISVRELADKIWFESRPTSHQN